jgi:hypothetical protein
VSARIHRPVQPEKRPAGLLPSEIAAWPIFDRGVYIGAISEAQGGQYEAGRADGQSLGLFTSPAAAAHALLETHHARCQ